MDKIGIRIKFIKKSIKEHALEYSAIFIAAFTIFSLIWPIIFAADDDIFSYAVVQKGEIIRTTLNSAIGQGRFWFLVSSFFSYFPFMFKNFVVYKLISYGSICFSVFSLGILLYRNINRDSAVLSILLFFTFLQLDGQHNLLVSYVFSHQIAIGLILLSIERLLAFYNSGRKKDLILSALLLLFSTILYETFILFSIFLFFISVLNYKKVSITKLRKILIDLRFHIVFMLFYLIIFFIWRHFYPGNYDGAKLQLDNVADSLKVIFRYGLARIPLVSTLHNYRNYDLNMIEPLFIIKGLVISSAVVIIIKKSNYLKKKDVLYSLMLCILGIFLPVLLHSVTPKYIEWVKAGSYAYLPSFYSYFFISAFLSIFSSFVYQLLEKKKRKVLLFFIFSLVFSGSILTDINNHIEAKNYQIRQEKNEAFDNAVSSEYFQEIENGAYIYIPDFKGINGYMPYTNYYASIYSGKQYIFTNRIEDLTFDIPTYGFHYDEITGSMLIGKLKKNMLVDEVYIINDKTIFGMTAILYQNNENLITVDEADQNMYGKVALIPIQTNNNFIKFEGTDIDLYNSCVINETLQYLPLQELIVFGNGFHGKEMWGNDIVYWCSSTGILELHNKADKDKYVTISARVACGDDKKSYLLELKGKDKEDNFLITASQANISFRLLLKPGKNEFLLHCDAPSLLTTNGDKRELVFYIMNLKMKFEEE